MEITKVINQDLLFSVKGELAIITGVSGKLGLEYAKAFLNRDAIVVGVDLNMNNAGIDAPPSADSEENGPFENYLEDSWDQVLDVNLKGVFLCSQVFGAAMVKNGYGSIVNISSIYGIVSPDQSLYEYRRNNGEQFFKPVAYSVSKSGILNLTRYMAVYWAKHNVRVNTLTLSGVYNNQDKDFVNAYCSRIPVGKMASPEDFIGPVIFLSSRGSSYMTGSNLVIDGGWTAI